jgi:hypothetical protein
MAAVIVGTFRTTRNSVLHDLGDQRLLEELDASQP